MTQKCQNCGAAVESIDGVWRHTRTIAKSCDLDDPSSPQAAPKE